MEQAIIRNAKKEDIKEILKIQNELLLSNRERDLKKDGFLVYPITSKEITNLIESNLNIIIVAVYENKVIGYGLTYDFNEWIKLKKEIRIETGSLIKHHLLNDRVLYFRHIARKDKFYGLGKQIEEEVYKKAKNKNYKFVVGEILEKPILNEKSKEVHIKRGFVKIGQITYGDGKIWGLYEKKL
jgi:L-amino acid N-acyltransferase YncA